MKTKYKVVEKDIEDERGWLHNTEYEDINEANKFVKTLREDYGKDYYEIFVVEVMEEW